MKGIRFYADLAGTSNFDENNLPVEGLPKRTTRAQLRERPASHHVNCIAVLLGEEHRCHDYTQEALSATFIHPNSDVSMGSVSRKYLRDCRHIDEALARKLHPRLFARLDAA